MKLRHLALLAAASLAAAVVQPASAASIFVNYINTTPSGSDFSWNYSTNLGGFAPGTSILLPGDYLIIADFTGVDTVATAAVQGSWTLTYEATSTLYVGGFTPAQDTAGKLNIKATWTGAPVVNDSPLGLISIISSVGAAQTGKLSYAGNDHEVIPPGDPQSNLGLVNGPIAVPLPAAAWGGMTLLGVLGAAKAARRRAMK